MARKVVDTTPANKESRMKRQKLNAEGMLRTEKRKRWRLVPVLKQPLLRKFCANKN